MVPSPSNSASEPSPGTPYFNPQHNHNEVRADYDDMMAILKEIEDTPYQEQPKKYWRIAKRKTEFKRGHDSVANLPVVQTDEDGTFALVNGELKKLCYDCNKRLPYYKGQCQPCRTEYAKQYQYTQRQARLRLVFEHYGNKCGWCGQAYNHDTESPNLHVVVRKEFQTPKLRNAKDTLKRSVQYVTNFLPKLEVLCGECNRWHKRGVNTRDIMLKLIYENDALKKPKDIRY